MNDLIGTAERVTKAVVLESPGQIAVHTLPVPRPEQGAVIIKVTLGGVCGTDAHLFHGAAQLPFPIVLGHEGIGSIEELGQGVTHDYTGVPVKPGDPVYWCPIAPCHHCWYCTVEKDFSSCTNSTWFGSIERPTWGSYAEYASLPAGAAFFRVPDDVPAEAVIAFGCAFPTVLQGLERLGGISPLQTVVVQGAGPVGLAATLMARLAGARSVITLDISPTRLALARRFGASETISLNEIPELEDRRTTILNWTGGRGADVVIEAAGRRESFSEGLNLCARNGSYLLIGLWASQGDVAFDPSHLVRNNIRMIGTQYAQARHYYEALMLVVQHHQRFPFSEVVTHRCSLSESENALELVRSGKAGKVVIAP